MPKKRKISKKRNSKKTNRIKDIIFLFAVLLVSCLLTIFSFFALLLTINIFKGAPPYALSVDIWKFLLPIAEIFVIYILVYISFVLFLRLVKNVKFKLFWDRKEKKIFLIAILVFLIYFIYFSWILILRDKQVKACRGIHKCGISSEEACNSLPAGLSNECYSCLGAAMKDPKICEKAGVFRNFSHRDACYFGLAVGFKDLNICGTIQSEKIREDCERIVKK